VTRLRADGNGWIKYNVLSTVQEFVRDSAVNHGFLIVNTRGSQEINFPSSENAKTEQRPKLTISYSETSSAVRPSAAILFHDKNTIVSARQRGIILVGNVGNMPVEVAVASPDGKRLSFGRIAAGERCRLPALGAGMRVVTVRDRFGSRTVTTFVP
jgi:hypothetical protein